MNSIKLICKELKKLETEIKKLEKTKDSKAPKGTKASKDTKPANSNKKIENCKTKKALERFTKDDLTKFVKTHKLKVEDCKKKLVKTIWEFINESESDDSDSEYEWEYYYSTDSEYSESSDDDSSSDDE
jgi:hypothetical protein